MVSRLIGIDVHLLLSARSAYTFANPNFIANPKRERSSKIDDQCNDFSFLIISIAIFLPASHHI